MTSLRRRMVRWFVTWSSRWLEHRGVVVEFSRRRESSSSLVVVGGCVWWRWWCVVVGDVGESVEAGALVT
ncbi:hypothetical protein ACXZ9C_10755 [Streptococcus agalactiae]